MKRYPLLLLILTLYSATPARACKCAVYDTTIDSLQQLNDFTFIAHVKITGLQETPAAIGTTAQWTFHILEQFKGSDTVTTVFDQTRSTSCDMAVAVGAEWIFFAYMKDGKMNIYPCDRNAQYRDTAGFRNFKYGRGVPFLERLQALYQHSQPAVRDGQQTTWYPNRQKETEVTWKDGKLNGTRILWYPDGKVYARESYVNGQPDGLCRWYYPSGQLSHEDLYITGRHSGRSLIFHDTAQGNLWRSAVWPDPTGPDPYRHYETLYNEAGRPIISREYNIISGSLRREIHTDTSGHLFTETFFYENGKIRYITHYDDKGIHYGRYQEYNEEGIPTRGGHYNDKNRLIWDKK